MPASTSRRWALLWLASVVGWTLYGLLYSYQAMDWSREAGEPYTWDYALRTNLIGMWGWIPMTVALFWLSTRFPIRRGGAARAIALLMAGALAMVALRAVYIYSLDPWVHWYKTPPDFWADVMSTSLQNNLVVAWVQIGLAHALLYFDRAHAQERHAAALQAQLAQARLDAIAARLNPHFLFNALNSIAELLHHDPVRADRMLVGLSALLRRSLDTTRQQWVSLREELELLAQYLEIEKVRLGERMQVHWHVAEDCLDEPVPPLLLQPLVENAIVHAIARRIRPGRVAIGAGYVHGALWLEIEDDGAEGSADAEGHGIGLASTRERLRALYAGAATLSIAANDSGGTRVELRLPRVPAPIAVAAAGHATPAILLGEAASP